MLIRLTVPGEDACVEDLNASLEAVLTRHGIAPGLRGDLRLIVEELASNAIHHGGANGESALSVRLSIADGLLKLDFRDSGTPFDPLSVPIPDLDADIMERNIGGLGLYLIRQLADELHYKRAEGCNLLHATLRITDKEQHPA